MDAARFDAFVRRLSVATTRRRVIQIAAALGLIGAGSAAHAAQDLGCCKCPGKRGCLTAPNQAECDAACGEPATFSEKHECRKGGEGTTEQCRLKTNKTEPAPPCPEPPPFDPADASPKSGFTSVGARLQEDNSTGDRAFCPPDAQSPEAVAALMAAYQANLARQGFAVRRSEVCRESDACRSGGLFGEFFLPIPESSGDLDVNEPPGSGVPSLVATELIRRDDSGQVSDIITHYVAMFADPYTSGTIAADSLPSGAVSADNDLASLPIARAIRYPGPKGRIAVDSTETLESFSAFGNLAITSGYSSAGGKITVQAIDQEWLAVLPALWNPPLALDPYLLAISGVRLPDEVTVPGSVRQFAVSVVDGQVLPLDGASPELTEFRRRSNLDVITAIRQNQRLAIPNDDREIGVTLELRELRDSKKAQAFIQQSPARIQEYFAAQLAGFQPITEFDGVSRDGLGFLYLITPPAGGFEIGATGYTRAGNRVASINIHLGATDRLITQDDSNLFGTGQPFANLGVEVLQGQLEYWEVKGRDRLLIDLHLIKTP